jgi:hypothetical protein
MNHRDSDPDTVEPVNQNQNIDLLLSKISSVLLEEAASASDLRSAKAESEYLQGPQGIQIHMEV